ncbi:uncharacterized protein SOCG_16241 [Schizosaccharomyces octosporus yFS286]|uniref:Uncharacterized protein n=1 Tax=Schizosaccharomyces octosporus (strain yFS286) TaxID=483514 RepID=S9RCC0_SCHOY|nr:uncharacterized protein SOCG_16241 [Schizosaccharomyces octosporus yFS286]EPX71769.1 hypothetical protein SOCG_16241 [Schizosaccharomyces octosporus yFS286]
MVETLSEVVTTTLPSVVATTPMVMTLMVTLTTINSVVINSLGNNNMQSSKSNKSYDQTSNSNSGLSSGPLDVSTFINAFSTLGGFGNNGGNVQKSGSQGSNSLSHAAVFSAVQKYFSQNGDALANGQGHSNQHQSDFLSMVEQEAQGLMNNNASGQGRGIGGSEGDVKSSVELAKTLFQNRNMLTKLAEAAGSSQASGNSAVLATVVGSFLGGSTSNNSNAANNKNPQAQTHGLQEMAASFLGPGNQNSNHNSNNSQGGGLAGLGSLAGSFLNSGNNNSGNQQGNADSGLAGNLLHAISGNNNRDDDNQGPSKHSEGGDGLVGKAINMFMQ